MATPSHPDAFELADYLRVLRRRWLIVVTLACIGALAAAGYIVKTPKKYTATSSVFVTANAASANALLGSRTSGLAVNMDNESQLVTSNPVAGPAAKALGSSQTPDQLVRQVSVQVPANTTVMQISCSGSTPRWAATCAEAFATSYLNDREALAKNKVAFEITQLEDRERQGVAKQLALRKQIAGAPARGPKRPLLHAEVQATKAQILTLRQDVSALSGSVNYNPGYVLTAAVAPTAPSSPKPLIDLPGGLLAGLVLGLIAAFVVDRRDDRIHAARDVERFLDLPVLLNLSRHRSQGQSVVLPHSGAGRAFTALAEGVASGLGDGNHVLFIAASSVGRGGGVVAANLAASLARIRSEVVLVCADPPGSGTSLLLGVDESLGLSDLLAHTARLHEAIHTVAGNPRLRVIPPGSSAALTGELAYEECERLVTELRRDARYVIVLAQATGTDTDMFTLAEFADAALVVAESSSTKKAEVAECVARLDRLRTPVLGAAVLAAGVLLRPAAPSVPAKAKKPGPAGRVPPGMPGAAERGGMPHSSMEPAMPAREAAVVSPSAAPPSPPPAPRPRKG